MSTIEAVQEAKLAYEAKKSRAEARVRSFSNKLSQLVKSQIDNVNITEADIRVSQLGSASTEGYYQTLFTIFGVVINLDIKSSNSGLFLIRIQGSQPEEYKDNGEDIIAIVDKILDVPAEHFREADKRLD